MRRSILSLIAILMAQGAVAEAVDTAAEVNWSSTAGQPAVLSQEISELYQTLYNSRNLK